MNSKTFKIGIRREDKSVWQRRSPLTPQDAKQILQKQKDIQIVVQPSKSRIFSEQQFEKNGAIIKQDLSDCDLIIGIKQVGVDYFIPQKTYMFFSHNDQGDSCYMPALDKMLELKIRLIDYEHIKNKNNAQLISTSFYAGIVGVFDFLKGFGEYIMRMGISTPFLNVNCAYKYFSVQSASDHLKLVGKKIVETSIPVQLRPMIFAVTGRGNTAKGCISALSNLPITQIKPDQVAKIYEDKHNSKHASTIYLVNLNSEDIMVPIDEKSTFNKKDYYENPQSYRPVFHQRYLPYISVLFNCIYWAYNFPTFITNYQLKELTQNNKLRLIGISDIGCYPSGPIQCFQDYTNPDQPFFYFDCLNEQQTFENSYKYGKIMYLGQQFLPSEFPYQASNTFSKALKQLVADIARSDSKLSYELQALSPQLKRGIVTLNGELTPNFKYIQEMRETMLRIQQRKMRTKNEKKMKKK